MISTLGSFPPSVIGRPSLETIPDRSTLKLHLAVINNKPRKIKKYLERGVPGNLYNQDGQPPLFCAVVLKRVKIVKILLKFGSDANVRCRDGSTPVHAAAFRGCTTCLKVLLIHGGDLRLTDGLRRTPLDWANLQPDMGKKEGVKKVVNAARLCARIANGLERLSEGEARFSPKKRTTWLSTLYDKVRGSKLRKCQHSQFLLKQSVIPVGYGKVYYGMGHNRRCGAVIGIPILKDMELDKKSGCSWICGKFTTFVLGAWKARKMPVAVRELRKIAVQDAVTDILVTELNSLVGLQHPNILMLLAICCKDNYESIALVFENVRWGSLHFYLHTQLGTLRAPSVLDIITQICDALEFIHATGYLHGFVNSHAIFLIERNRAKLGCCEYMIPITAGEEDIQRSQHPLFRSDSHLTEYRHWVAPEIITTKRPASIASDIYSLCCVIWELVHGEVPWKEYSVEALRELMTEIPYAQLPLDKKCVPPMWYHMLKMGLEPEVMLRDLRLSEVRNMMRCCREVSSQQKKGEGQSNRDYLKSSEGACGGGDVVDTEEEG